MPSLYRIRCRASNGYGLGVIIFKFVMGRIDLGYRSNGLAGLVYSRITAQ